jgi:hypothetical protein
VDLVGPTGLAAAFVTVAWPVDLFPSDPAAVAGANGISVTRAVRPAAAVTTRTLRWVHLCDLIAHRPSPPDARRALTRKA